MKKTCKYLLKGIPAAPGIAIGKVYILTGDRIQIEERSLSESEVEGEVDKFRQAIQSAKLELQKMLVQLSSRTTSHDARIFDVHQMLLEDYSVINQMIEAIRTQRKNAALVFFEQMNLYQQKMETLNNSYLKERAADILDVKQRVLRHLHGEGYYNLSNLTESRVIVARDLTPSDTIMLDRRKILGFATDMGGRTSHAAILARALEIPSVLGLGNLTEIVTQDQTIIVDGNRGEVFIEPSPSTLKVFRKLQKEYSAFEQELANISELPCQTLDGKAIELAANLEFPGELDSVIAHGAKGIGLYRTEYLYLARPELPSEEEQYQAYQEVAARIYPNSVIIRTADLGGDKSPRSLPIPREENPALGWRAIRICLKEIDMFKAQLRAILRASVRGNVKIMFPMITSIEELYQSLELLDSVKVELRIEGIPFNAAIEIGTMIEVPSAAIMSDVIAAKVNFLSLGTNDLIQYTLAVDRSNERISYLYENFPPAVLRLIKQVIDAGHRKGIWVGLCGEMASDPQAILILVGLGLDEFSVSPVALPKIKQIIRSIEYAEAAEIAQRILAMETGSEIQKYIEVIMAEKFKHLPFLAPSKS